MFGFVLFEDGPVFFGEGGDLAGDVVADGVQAGHGFAVFGFGACAFLRVGSVGVDLLLGGHGRGSTRGRFHD